MQNMQSFAARIVLLGVTLLPAAATMAATDGGTVNVHPWSGYWWQHKTGGLTGPLGKYDKAFGAEAADWEQSTHVSADVPAWYGHCHAWAASAVSEREPRGGRAVSRVSFGVGDQKGLLAACHAQDVSNSYGDRYGDGVGSEDPADLLPDELWRRLQMYVKQQKIPLILDLEAGEQVWNYPVYQYRVDYAPASGGWHQGVLQLVVADNNVRPDYVGTKAALHKYTFRVKIEGGAVVVGSGQWTGESVNDHPDFAWYPYVAVAENPEVEVEDVSKVVGFAVGGNNPPDEDSGDDPPDEDSDDDPSDDGPSDDGPVDLPPPDEDQSNNPAEEIPVGDILSPDELVAVVLNKKSSFPLDAFVDRGDGGRYRQGEPIRVSVRAGRAGCLYLFDVGPQGDLRLVFPAGGEPNYLRKDVLYDIPVKGLKPTFLAEEAGQHDLKAILTARLLQITGFPALPEQKPRAGQAAPRQQPQPPAVSKPQKMIVHPTAQRRLQQRVFGAFRKGVEEKIEPPGKLGPFAQDACAYFVMPAASK